jgi:hypothetical protein
MCYNYMTYRNIPGLYKQILMKWMLTSSSHLTLKIWWWSFPNSNTKFRTEFKYFLCMPGMLMNITNQKLLRWLRIPCFVGVQTFITVFKEPVTEPQPLSKTEVISDNLITYLSLYGDGLLASPPNTQIEDPLLVCCPQLFNQHIHGWPLYFPHLQPEDVPMLLALDPLNMDCINKTLFLNTMAWYFKEFRFYFQKSYHITTE